MVAEGCDHRLDVHTPKLGRVRQWFGSSPFGRCDR
jgi:hypothetical protein